MAKVTAPLLSLGASGTIGKTLTFGKWKGINTARQRITPANPRSTGQTAQRSIMSNVVAFWRGFMTGLLAKAAWNRDATASGKPQSGFNAFTSAATKVAAQVVAGSFAIGCSDQSVDGIIIDMANLDDGTAGDEAGDFSLAVGASPNQMLNSYDAALAIGAGTFDVSADFAAGDVVYAQLTKTAGTIVGAKRSGIFQITLIE